ncbi:hypothetical protein [Marmot herpesvirus 1]|nr:hypothetical protein [Marmot herpesvirus 1]
MALTCFRYFISLLKCDCITMDDSHTSLAWISSFKRGQKNKNPRGILDALYLGCWWHVSIHDQNLDPSTTFCQPATYFWKQGDM